MAADQKAILESIRDIMSGSDDDVLVLTQKVNADGSVTKLEFPAARTTTSLPPENISHAELQPAADILELTKPAVSVVDEEPDDILGAIDALLSEPQKSEIPAEVVAAPAPQPIVAAPEPTPTALITPEVKPEPIPEPVAVTPPPPVIEQPIQAPAVETIVAAPPTPVPEPIIQVSPAPEPVVIVTPTAPEPPKEIPQKVNGLETNIELELAEVIEKTQLIEKTLEDQMDNIENLLSAESAGTAKSSISNLMDKVRAAREPKTDPSAAFRSGETVENLVMEMLKPMLKEWIDNNLPALVESIVQKEIQKIATL